MYIQNYNIKKSRSSWPIRNQQIAKEQNSDRLKEQSDEDQELPRSLGVLEFMVTVVITNGQQFGERFNMNVSIGEPAIIALKRVKRALKKKGVDPDLLRDSTLLKQLIPFSEVRRQDRVKLFYLEVSNMELINHILRNPVTDPTQLQWIQLQPPTRDPQLYYSPQDIFASPVVRDLIRVENLVIGKEGVGQVRFIDPVNVHELNFKKYIKFRGEGVIDVKGPLKQPAIVVLLTPSVNEDMEQLFVKRVKLNLEQKGHQFVEFKRKQRELHFRVNEW